MKNQHETPEALAHALFTAAQLAPGEGIEDAVGRLAALVEAHQHARIAELEAQLSSSGFTAADMATASAQGFRDGVASIAASAGEPTPELQRMTASRAAFFMERFLREEKLLGPNERAAVQFALNMLEAAPQQEVQEPCGWTRLPGALPEPGTPVLLDIGKKYPIRAMWAAKHTVEAADDDTDWAEYDEATETYYCPEGWYEWNEFEETHWAVNEIPSAWTPLPPTTSAGSGKGE